ncbi:MAG: hypothetical protein C4570_03440 [Ammonifex sp.]|nr:MAG: hypothetical protein C4570_03440 [Ammonifex sp.]
MDKRFKAFSKDWTQQTRAHMRLEKQRAEALRQAAADEKAQYQATLGALAKVGIGLAAVGLAAKKAFEFAEAGAELDYARDKFDRLAQTVGVTGDALLRDLGQATKGLVDDATLIAGAGDLMSLGLAKTRDEAVRLTTVIGRLGMDMNQVVLTLTNRTKARFDQLGVSVDGFDEKVNKLKESGYAADEAFKLAFIQQAEAQLGRVGDIAESAAGDFRSFNAELKNYTDNMAILASQMGGFLQPMTKWLQVNNDIDAAVIAGNITRQEGLELYKALRRGVLDAVDVYWILREAETGLTRAQLTEIDRLNALARAYPPVVQGAVDAAAAIREQRIATQEAHGAGRDWADTLYETEAGLEGAAAAVEALRKKTEAANEPVQAFLEGIDRSIASPIGNFIKDLEWMMATGGRFEEAFGAIQTALDQKKITPEQADEFTKNLFVAVQDVSAELGEIDVSAAATNISQTLGISLEEALALINGTDGIEAAMATITTTEWFISDTLGMSLTAVQDLVKGGDGSVWDKLVAVTEKQWTVDVTVNYNDPGFSPKGGGGGSGGGRLGGEREEALGGELYVTAPTWLLVGERGMPETVRVDSGLGNQNRGRMSQAAEIRLSFDGPVFVRDQVDIEILAARVLARMQEILR